MPAASDFSDAPPLYAVQPRFHLRNFLRRWPLFVIIGGAFGAIVAANVDPDNAVAYAIAVPVGILLIAGVAYGWARMRLPDSWYAIHADRIAIRWGGPLRSNDNRPLMGIENVEIHQTASEKASGIGTVRLWRKGKGGRVKEDLRNVPDPEEFVRILKPVVAKAQDPRAAPAIKLF